MWAKLATRRSVSRAILLAMLLLASVAGGCIFFLRSAAAPPPSALHAHVAPPNAPKAQQFIAATPKIRKHPEPQGEMERNDGPAAAMAWRRMRMVDENGQIPANAL